MATMYGGGNIQHVELLRQGDTFRTTACNTSNPWDPNICFPVSRYIEELCNARVCTVEISSCYALIANTELFVFEEGLNVPIYHEVATLKCIAPGNGGMPWIYRTKLVPAFWKDRGKVEGKGFLQSQ